MAAPKKGGLGRGLDALFMDAVPAFEEEAVKEEPKKETKAAKKEPVKKENSVEDTTDKVLYLDIHSIMPNVNQPRKTFDEEKIAELSDSIKENGIIQPIVVRKKGKGYEIVAGERRWRASMKAELSKVPCIIRELSDEQNMLFAIIENMQREDLNPVEEAEGINQMIAHFGLTQEEVSKSVGKSRPYITNALRLLKLPQFVKDSLAKNEISQGHARTLVSVENDDFRRQILDKIIKEGLSVRETEKIANEIGKPKKKASVKKDKDPDVKRVEEELKEAVGTKVNIIQLGKKGKIEIEYFSRDELDRLIDLLKSINQ